MLKKTKGSPAVEVLSVYTAQKTKGTPTSQNKTVFPYTPNHTNQQVRTRLPVLAVHLTHPSYHIYSNRPRRPAYITKTYCTCIYPPHLESSMKLTRLPDHTTQQLRVSLPQVCLETCTAYTLGVPEYRSLYRVYTLGVPGYLLK